MIQQLATLGYVFVPVHDGDALLHNLQSQLDQFNNTSFTSKEFSTILNHLAKGNFFEKLKQ